MMCPKCLNDGGFPGKYCYYCGTFLREEDEPTIPSYSREESSDSMEDSGWFKQADDLLGAEQETSRAKTDESESGEPEGETSEAVPVREELKDVLKVKAKNTPKQGLIIGSIVAAVLICIAVLAVILLSGGSDKADEDADGETVIINDILIPGEGR